MAGFDNEVVYGKNADFTSVDNQDVQLSNGLVTNGKMWIGSTAVNAGGTHINVGTITSPLGTLNIGYASPNITMDLAGGATAVDSFVPNSGTSPVVPDSNGQITIQGAGSITVVGGLNSLTPQLTGLTANTILLGAGTSTINPLPNSTTGTLLAANTGADPGWTSTLEGSFTLAKSNSGADISLFVENLSNTASSTASVVVQVAGSTASDAFIRTEIAGAQKWAFGLDNSDSDAYVISSNDVPGTNNVMRVATTGEINFPLQSAFLAELATTVADVTGDGTTYTIVLDTEIFDQNNDFNGTTTYTAPITARVFLNAKVLFGGLDATDTAAACRIVTSNRTYQLYTVNPSTIHNSGQLGWSGSCFADMDVGDTATVTVTVSGGAKVVDIISAGATDPRTWFSGYIAC